MVVVVVVVVVMVVVTRATGEMFVSTAVEHELAVSAPVSDTSAPKEPSCTILQNHKIPMKADSATQSPGQHTAKTVCHPRPQKITQQFQNMPYMRHLARYPRLASSQSTPLHSLQVRRHGPIIIFKPESEHDHSVTASRPTLSSSSSMLGPSTVIG